MTVLALIFACFCVSAICAYITVALASGGKFDLTYWDSGDSGYFSITLWVLFVFTLAIVLNEYRKTH